MIHRRRAVVVASVCVFTTAIVTGCGAGHDGDDRPVVEVEVDGMAAIDAWSRPTPPDVDTAAIYLTIENRAAPADRITGARSSRCASVIPHLTVIDDEGVATMPTTLGDELLLSPGGSVTMAPNGLHLMCLGLGDELDAGDRFEVEIAFHDHAPLVVPVMVEQR